MIERETSQISKINSNKQRIQEIIDISNLITNLAGTLNIDQKSAICFKGPALLTKTPTKLSEPPMTSIASHGRYKF